MLLLVETDKETMVKEKRSSLDMEDVETIVAVETPSKNPSIPFFHQLSSI